MKVTEVTQRERRVVPVGAAGQRNPSLSAAASAHSSHFLNLKFRSWLPNAAPSSSLTPSAPHWEAFCSSTGDPLLCDCVRDFLQVSEGRFKDRQDRFRPDINQQHLRCWPKT